MNRAFVIQIAPECRPGQTFIGRVEHVRTGRAIHFTKVGEFLDFVSRSVDAEAQVEELEQLEQLEQQEGSSLPE